MEQTTPAAWTQRLRDPRTLRMIAISTALGVAAAAGLWWLVMRPRQAVIQKRFESTIDIAKLYGLELSYKKAKGTYANDLASLLSISPEAQALKASLAANVDMSTLAVDGDEQKFRIELNVLDPERTLIKISGPIAPRPAFAAPVSPPADESPSDSNGAPIFSGR